MIDHEPAIRRSVQESSQLSPELWNDPRCQREADGLVRLLLRPGMLELFAIHEAGHEIYYRRAGCTTFIFDSPRIIYKKENEHPFTEQRARIRIGEWIQPEGDDWLSKLAKGYAAGGECSRKLTSTDYAGDTIDRQLWNDLCADCYKGTATDEEIKTIADDMWDKAQKQVGIELEEVMKARIQKRAKEIMPQLFPWLRAQDSHR